MAKGEIWGIFEWDPTGVYKREKAKKEIKNSRKRAQSIADAMEGNVVVRPIREWVDRSAEGWNSFWSEPTPSKKK